MPVEIPLSALSWCDFFFATSTKFIQHRHFFLSLVTGSDDSDEYPPGADEYPSGLDVTRNISTLCPALREQKALTVGCELMGISLTLKYQ
jgi:hypothetical protein